MRQVEQKQMFRNKLENATSPYLRQHAGNPVYWYPWGKEAFDRAREEQRPILLSIGYSSCYWCHVMEREVFENVSIASLMNRFFINIKVDREELPLIDDVYMLARHLLTQQGGWPNTVFLTPDLKPFHAGGTYFAEDHGDNPSFPRVLEWINHEWTTQNKEILAHADKVVETMQEFLFQRPPEGASAPEIAREAASLFQQFKQRFDPMGGGFSQAPKFPSENFLQFLMGYYEHTKTPEALNMVTFCLQKMAAGGINDQVGCGFHRYAVDKQWLIPHFEKMLFNQAQLARTYAEAARLTGNPYFADVACSILDFTSGPLTSGEGGFYTSVDAENDGVEGAYYAWTAEEISALLTPDEVNFFTTFFALADIPTFPGHPEASGQVIVARKPFDVAAADADISYVEFASLAGQIMNKLLAARNLRIPPALDNKIIVAWNGLMIDAFAHAGRVLEKPHYISMAKHTASYLLDHAIDNDGNLKRLVVAGQPEMDATFEDFAYLIRGLLSLHKAAPDDIWINSARALADTVEDLFADPKTAGGYLFAVQGQHDWMNTKTADDSAMPSPNGIMVHNLIDIFELTGQERFLATADNIIKAFFSGRDVTPPEYATITHAALRLNAVHGKENVATPPYFVPASEDAVGVVRVNARLEPETAAPGQECELVVELDVRDGWYIGSDVPQSKDDVPTLVDIRPVGIELLEVRYPAPTEQHGRKVFAGKNEVRARLKLLDTGDKRVTIQGVVGFAACKEGMCHRPKTKFFAV